MTFEHAVKIRPRAVGGVHYRWADVGRWVNADDPRGLTSPGVVTRPCKEI